jgi:hypothetical protein
MEILKKGKQGNKIGFSNSHKSTRDILRADFKC